MWGDREEAKRIAARVEADLRDHQRECTQRWKEASEAAEKSKGFLSDQLNTKVHEINLKLDRQTDSIMGLIRWGGGLLLTAMAGVITLLIEMLAHRGGLL